MTHRVWTGRYSVPQSRAKKIEFSRSLFRSCRVRHVSRGNRFWKSSHDTSTRGKAEEEGGFNSNGMRVHTHMHARMAPRRLQKDVRAGRNNRVVSVRNRRQREADGDPDRVLSRVQTIPTFASLLFPVTIDRLPDHFTIGVVVAICQPSVFRAAARDHQHAVFSRSTAPILPQAITTESPIRARCESRAASRPCKNPGRRP